MDAYQKNLAVEWYTPMKNPFGWWFCIPWGGGSLFFGFAAAVFRTKPLFDRKCAAAPMHDFTRTAFLQDFSDGYRMEITKSQLLASHWFSGKIPENPSRPVRQWGISLMGVEYFATARSP